jgi:hypothetical protein
MTPTHAFAESPEDPPVTSTDRPSVVTNDKSIDSLYLSAIAALAADQPVAAREMLEAVVTARPEYAGAWLDLALAAYRSGDVEAGLEHLEYLRSHFSLPPALASQVGYWYKRWQQPASQTVKKHKWQGELTIGYGHDTNVNAGLSSNNLSLTFFGNNIDFPVDRKSLPYADDFSLLSVTTWGPALVLDEGSITPLLVLRGKRFNSQSDYDNLDMQAGAVYLRPAEESGSWRVAAFVQQYRLGGNTLNNAVRLNAQRNYSWSNCQISAGGEMEYRHAKEDAEIGGNLFSLTGGLNCPMPWGGSISSQLRMGQTRPREGWPGGTKNGHEFALQYSHPFANERRLDLTWRSSWLNDTEGYSPLLENNEARRIFRQDLSLSLRQQLTTEWDALVTAEILRQRSNLELFSYNGSSLMIGVVRRF